MNGHDRIMSIGSLYQIGGEGLTDYRDAYSYLIWPEGSEYADMIDCGSIFGAEELKVRLGKLGLGAANIRNVYATHGDVDHVGAYDSIFKASDTKFLVPTPDIDAVVSGDSIKTAAPHYGIEATPMDVDGEVVDGDCFTIGNAVIRAFLTGGHTPGEMCYEIEENGIKTLLPGDTFFSFYFLNRSKNIEEDVYTGRESVGKLVGRDYHYIGYSHAVLGFRGDGTRRVTEAYRQFAPHGVSILVDKAKKESKPYVEPFYKVHGQYYRY